MIRRAVLDASAAVEVVLPGSRAADLMDLLDGCPLVLAPGLYFSEVANALWKYVRAGEVGREEAASLFETAVGLVDRTVPDADLAQEALSLAVSTSHPVYDLLYATLARRLGCTVVTLDRRLWKLLNEMAIPCWSPGRAA